MDLYACFLIPAYTLLYAGGAKWFTTNFSVLAASGLDRFVGCLYWGILLGAYFLVMLVLIGRTLERRRDLWWLTALACVCLVTALLLPYMPDHLPGIAYLHVLLAFGSCVLMMLVLLLVLLRCRRQEGERYDALLRRWGGIVIGSVLLFVPRGIVSSAQEVFFAISAALLVRRLWLYRCEEHGI